MVCMFTLFTPFRLLNFCSNPFTWFKPFNVSLCLNLCGFIKKYFQPHFVLQHSPHFLQEMHFLVLCDIFNDSVSGVSLKSPFPTQAGQWLHIILYIERTVFWRVSNLTVDLGEPVSTVPALQVNIVVAEAQQCYAASGLQHPLGLRQEALLLEPVGCRRRRQQVHRTVRKGQLLRRPEPFSGGRSKMLAWLADPVEEALR